MTVMENLAVRYKMERHDKNEEKLSGEIEIEYSDVQNRAQQVIDSLSNSTFYDKFLNALSHSTNEQTEPHQNFPPVTRNRDHLLPISCVNQSQFSTDSVLIELEMWKQLKRMTLPVFSRDKRPYHNWKTTFIACMDQTPATA